MIANAPVTIDPRAREVRNFTRAGGRDFELELSCGHVMKRRVMIGSVPSRAICNQCPPDGGIHTAPPSTVAPKAAPGARRRRRRPATWFDWSEENVARLKELWSDDTITIDEIATRMGAKTRNVIIGKAFKLKLPRRKRGPRSTGRSSSRLPQHGGWQRRFVGATGRKNRYLSLSRSHPAAKNGRTRFLGRVTDSSTAKHVLVGGENSRKIGRVITKGRWRGMPIFTLTLEERRTCPRSCQQWLNCYGNNMNWALRIREDGAFLIHLTSELLRLQARHPRGFVVRLHVLGDFFSTAYVGFWAKMLADLPALRVFGYTARGRDTIIGAALHDLVEAHWDRFALRWSNGGSQLAASEVVEERSDARGVVCPAELDENRSCSTCGLCWASGRGAPAAPAVPLISFLRH